METHIDHSDEAVLIAPAASSSIIPAEVSASDPMSLMSDQLSFDFSGSALQELEQLGVSAFDSSEIERNVLAEAIAQDKINEEQKQQQIEAALAATDGASAKPAASARSSPTIARPRIPKKGGASASASSSSRPSPTIPRKPHKEIVHPAEKPISKKYRKQYRSSDDSDQGDGSGDESEEEHKGGSESRSSLTPSIAPGRVKELAKNFKRNDEEWNARQSKIALGEVTPFSTIQGAEKQFMRVATSRVDAPSATAKKKASSAVAAAARPSITKGPLSASQQIAAARAAASNAPFPFRMAAAAAAATAAAPKALTPLKGVGVKAKLSTKKSDTSKKRKRASSSSSEDDSSTDMSDSPSATRKTTTKTPSRSPVPSESRSNSPPVKKERIVTHPWTCEACTYINPSDFVNRCEMCQTVRKNASNLSNNSNGQVKQEPGASPSKQVYIEISSDSEEIDGKAVARRKPVKIEDDDEEFGAEDAAAAAEEEEADEKDDEEDDEEVEEDAAVADEVDRALKKEAEAEDEEQDSQDAEDDGYDHVETYAQRAARGRKSKFSHDDYEDWRYDERVDAFRAFQSVLMSQSTAAAASAGADGSVNNADHLDVAFDGGYILPAYLWNKLFAYQKTCIKWLWELHEQNVGGIIADEMGLGKTIQIIAFLAGLHHSAQFDTVGSGAPSSSTVAKFRNQGPTLIVVPATLLSQWMREFHEWYPELRIFVLHDSVGHDQKITRKDLVQKVYQTNGVLITTYQSMRTCKTLLLPRQWAYVILDEGHKIRNPDAHITLLVKQLKCIHRLILTGSPIQNRLTELWSLFDFVFPGKLGTLPVFEDEICFPILYGGYTGASSVQIALAYKCAVILRDAINPYILRRTKADVMQHLPKKTEHILFCHLTDEQHDIYARFLDSHAKDIGEILQGKLSLFHVIHLLRKIANHPDLLDLNTKEGKKKSIKATMREFNLVNRKSGGKKKYDDDSDEENDAANKLSTRGADYGAVSRSGKMQVVEQILKLFKEQGHRVLIFSQTRQMLDILEKFVRQTGYTYRRMDGSTSIKQRLPLMDEFNHNPSIFIMLLTTRAGGLGVNLTGANRVILYDPDWNPSTDAQARERAYRIGQQREVTVYRLITRGCIEEKVYHRQIWKQFLTDKVLKDPEQKRFFSNNDIKDLFSLAPLHSRKKAEKNQTATIFEEAGGVINKREVIAQESQRQLEEAMVQRRLAAEEAAEAVKAEKEEGEIDDSMELEEGEIIDETPAGASAFFPDAKPTPLDNPPPLEGANGVAATVQVKSEPTASASATSEEHPRKKQKPNSAVKKEKTGLSAEESMLDIAPYVDPLAVDQKKKSPAASPTSRDGSGAAAAAASGAEGSSAEQDNNRILAALFSREGIESAMDHDVILAASTTSEKTRADAHANKQAQKAMHALKASRREMRDAPINKPTWTGKHGVSGAPPGLRGEAPKPRFGTTTRKPSSNSAVGAAGASAVNTTAEGLQDARLRPAVFANPNSAAAASSSSSSAKHFDSSVSGFSAMTQASPSVSSSASSSRPSAGGAVSSSTLLERMKARNAITQR